jgi:hypothetical protein
MDATPRNPTPEKRRPAVWEAGFLRALARRGVVSDACRAARVDRTTAYDARRNHPDFAAAWAAALEEAMDALELEAVRRATRRARPSDTLLIFLLKGGRPQKYRERIDHRHTGAVGSTPLDLGKLPDEDLDTLDALLRKAADPGTGAGGEGAAPPR